jgi:hypothetical protein
MAVEALRRAVVARSPESTGRREPLRQPLQLGQGVDLPGQVVEPHRPTPACGRVHGGPGLFLGRNRDFEQAEIVVVGRAGGLEEGGAPEPLGQDVEETEAEDIAVKGDAALDVSHIEDGMVQTRDGHGALLPGRSPLPT